MGDPGSTPSDRPETIRLRAHHGTTLLPSTAPDSRLTLTLKAKAEERKAKGFKGRDAIGSNPWILSRNATWGTYIARGQWSGWGGDKAGAGTVTESPNTPPLPLLPGTHGVPMRTMAAKVVPAHAAAV